MKRLFVYLLVVMLYPQVISAVILVPKPTKHFTMSQTRIVPIQEHKDKSYYAPGVWTSHHSLKQEGERIIGFLEHQGKLQDPVMRNRNLAHHKPRTTTPSGTAHIMHRNLYQVLR